MVSADQKEPQKCWGKQALQIVPLQTFFNGDLII